MPSINWDTDDTFSQASEVSGSTNSGEPEPRDGDTINTEERSDEESRHSSDDEWIDNDDGSQTSIVSHARRIAASFGRAPQNRQPAQLDNNANTGGAQPVVANQNHEQPANVGRVPNRKGRGWTVVINNPLPEDRDRLVRIYEHGLATARGDGSKCDYLVYQMERGQSGTLHIQGYLHFKAPVTLRSIIISLQRTNGATVADLRVANGTAEQNRVYCTKVDSREPGDDSGPFEYGEVPSERGKRNDLKRAIDLIKEGSGKRKLYDEVPTAMVQFNNGLTKMHKYYAKPRTSKTTVHWYYGPPGSGKSRAAFSFIDSLDPLVATELRTQFGADLYYNKSCDNKWWCGYDGQPIVVLDDLRPDGALSLSYLLTLLDRYALNNEEKGGQVNFTSPYIIITCPVNPVVFWQRLIQNHKVLPEEDAYQLYRRIDHVQEFVMPVDEPDDVARARNWVNQLMVQQNNLYNFGN